MKKPRILLTALIAVLVGACAAPVGTTTAPSVQLMVVGNDQKYAFDQDNKRLFRAPGNDTVSIVDIGTKPEDPRVVASLPLMNSIFGPPTNLSITPDEGLAIVANSVNWVQDGATWKASPDNKLYVIDLRANPPRHLSTVEVGKQPSGLAINRRGDLALVANRADKSLSVLTIQGKDVKLVDTVPMGDEVAAVAFTPDGKRALAAKFASHKIALLTVDGQKVIYTKSDVPVGLWPYNVEITPDGKIALTADNGAAGAADGHVDTVSVIDLETPQPRVIDRVVVGDAPEGLAISPTGKIAVAVLLKGSSAPKTSWFYNRNGSVVVLRIDGKQVSKVQEIEVGGLPEGVVFSRDGKYLYVGNFMNSDVSILRVEGVKLVDTGTRLRLPGQPASMRGPAR